MERIVADGFPIHCNEEGKLQASHPGKDFSFSRTSALIFHPKSPDLEQRNDLKVGR